MILDLRLSNQKPPRWDQKYIRNKILEYQKTFEVDSIQKIWVCGPPMLEELFDDYLYKLSKEFNLDFRTQVDIM